MSKSAELRWVLNDDWAVSRDKYNWILLARKGNRWRPESYFRTPEQLLKSLHKHLLRTMPANQALLTHLETAYKAGERLSERLSLRIHNSLGKLAKLTPQRAAAIEEVEAKYYAS